MASGPAPLHQHRGASTLAVIVSAPLVVVVPLAEVAVAPLHVAAVATTLLARTIAGTATMIDETAVTVPAAQMIGRLRQRCGFVMLLLTPSPQGS